MSASSRLAASLRSRALAVLTAIALALSLGVSLPASGGVLAADAAAPGGRLVVVWKSDAAAAQGPRVRVSRIERIAQRISVVIAPTGQSGTLAAALRADPAVVSVVPDVVVSIDAWPSTDGTPNDPYYGGFQADLARTRMPEAWSITTGSRSTIVAVLDTGFTPHSDFDSSAIVHPRNVIAGTTNVTDGHGHGTHVTGTIAARANNGAGIAGIAPNVSLMPVKVLGDNGSGLMSHALMGVDWARTHGASVINLSLGAHMTPTQAAPFRSVFDEAISAGVVIVAAAGNDGSNNVSDVYPAAFPGVLAVGSTTNSDARAGYSNAGPHNFISAPGSSILSLDNDGQHYVSMSGTSMATPHVVGAVALLRSRYPAMTVGRVAEILCVSAVDLGASGRDDVFGCGRLDVYAALTRAGLNSRTPTVRSRGPTVSSQGPVAGTSNASRKAAVTVVFSENVKGVSTKTIWIVNTKTGAKVKATATYRASNRTATLRPSVAMTGRTRYMVVIGNGITDMTGDKLGTRSWVFTTSR
jgi:serine protease